MIVVESGHNNNWFNWNLCCKCQEKIGKSHLKWKVICSQLKWISIFPKPFVKPIHYSTKLKAPICFPMLVIDFSSFERRKNGEKGSNFFILNKSKILAKKVSFWKRNNRYQLFFQLMKHVTHFLFNRDYFLGHIFNIFSP